MFKVALPALAVGVRAGRYCGRVADTGEKSIYGNADARRRRTLEAAATLLDEGGYTALTIRSVAQRAGTSTGLIYQYFVDKPDIFVTLLNESQLEACAFMAGLPRDRGVAAFLELLIPEVARHWARVGRYSATWRDLDAASRDAERESIREVRRTAREYNEDLRQALTEAAEAEGLTIADDPAALPFILSGLQGVADTIVHRPDNVDPAELARFAASSLARAISAPGAQHEPS